MGLLSNPVDSLSSHVYGFEDTSLFLIASLVFRRLTGMNPTNLLGLSQSELADFSEDLGESRYRGKQLFHWIYSKGVTDIDRMTNLRKTFRDELRRSTTVAGLTLVAEQRSTEDSTTKYLFALEDGARIESVLVPPAAAFTGPEAVREEEQRRLTLCVSTQVGCPLGCAFCATATMGYLRNLTSGEIIDQILQARRISRRNITNVVFMGMGEPMMNYDNVMKAVNIITAGIGIAAKHITVSTAGWADRIRQMGDERQRAKLAVSLHSADDETRTRLMPITKRFNLQELLSSIEYYYKKTRQRVTYEYIFFEGVNDSDKDVAGLVKLARRVPCKINVIPFHSIHPASRDGALADLRRSPRTERIVETLRESNLTVFVRSSAGEDIDAACGQLAIRMDRKHPSRPRGAGPVRPAPGMTAGGQRSHRQAGS